MSNKEFMKVYHMPFKAQEIKDDNFTNFRLQFDQAFEEMTKSFAEQQDETIVNYLYEKYKDTKVSDVWVLSKPDFEKFLLEMLPKWKEPKQYLKWEDLEFNIDKQMMTVLLNGTKYTLIVGRNMHIDKLAFLKNGEINYYFLEADKQFFNDLRLERVEE